MIVIHNFIVVPEIEPRKELRDVFIAIEVLLPPIISPINAPAKGPKTIPSGGKINIPAIRPRDAPYIPDFVPPIILLLHIGK